MHRALILLADSDAACAQRLKNRLESNDFRITHAATAPQLVGQLQQMRPQIVVIADRLQDISGLAALQIVRELDAGVKIIMKTTDPSEQHETVARSSGLIWYAVEPVSLEELTSVIINSLYRKYGQPENPARIHHVI